MFPPIKSSFIGLSSTEHISSVIDHSTKRQPLNMKAALLVTVLLTVLTHATVIDICTDRDFAGSCSSFSVAGKNCGSFPLHTILLDPLTEQGVYQLSSMTR